MSANDVGGKGHSSNASAAAPSVPNVKWLRHHPCKRVRAGKAKEEEEEEGDHKSNKLSFPESYRKSFSERILVQTIMEGFLFKVR